jgi:hypothetical protein
LAKAIDVISVLLLLLAAIAFALGMRALGDRQDLSALYWLVVGALTLRSATDLLRPVSGSR